MYFPKYRLAAELYEKSYLDKDEVQPAHEVPGMSPEGPLIVLTFEISRDPSGDSQETNTNIDDLMKKLFFRCSSPVKHYTSIPVFYWKKTIIQKV